MAKLPVLTRAEIQEKGGGLIATGGLRPMDRGAYDTKTSGSTGQSVTVRHSRTSGDMWGFLKQREYRWFRTDPGKPMATISTAGNLPPNADGGPVVIGQTVSFDSWRYVGSMFKTGPWFGYLNDTPIDQQIDWIGKIRPAYLVALAAELEHLAMAWGKGDVPENLDWLLASSMQMTGGMRKIIARTFPQPLHQNYGLNEIGLVASVCPEGGRYHIHCENALVEILDDAGKVCAPGTVGHLIVTSLNNRIMPLIRYDTDDLAEAADGPCPCGRTLPAFQRIHGRYRRTAYLPPGTYELWMTFRGIVPDMPPALLENVRRFQLHQFLDGSFELRLELADHGRAGPVTAWFDERWRALGEELDVDHPLAVVLVDHFENPRGGKFQDFESDFTPGPDDDEGP